MKEKESYKAAFEELQSILKNLQNGDAEIDELGELVKRAKTLITFCQERLREIDGEVKDLLDA